MGIVRGFAGTLILCSAMVVAQSTAPDSATKVPAKVAAPSLPQSHTATFSPASTFALQPLSFGDYRVADASYVDADGFYSSSSAHPDPIVSTPVVPPAPRVHWKPALSQSARFLLIMHAFRFATEPSTRAEIRGPFWGDYFDSVLGTDGWSDGDPKMVNYIGHPLEGAAAGFMFIQNDDRGRKLEFGKSPDYWKSRMKAMAWSAVFSVQFELGPVSEASLGNVGKDTGPNGQTYMGAVDLVVTPLMGVGWIFAEDALDRYAIRGIESRSDSRVLRAFTRGLLNPSRSFANMMRGKVPWYRDTRPLSGEVLADHFPQRPVAAAEPANSTSARSGH